MEGSIRQRATVSPSSVVRKTTRGLSSTGTWFSTTSTRQPAASADLAPVLESSMARHSSGGTPSAAAAVRYGSGCGLPNSTCSPVTTTENDSGGRWARIGATNRW